MKEQCYQYTTDLLVIGCGFSGMWAAMRARDFLGDVLVVDKGPRDWGGLGGLSGGDMIVKQPDMKLDDLLDDWRTKSASVPIRLQRGCLYCRHPISWPYCHHISKIRANG